MTKADRDDRLALTTPEFRISYAWAMPSPRTFSVKPIGEIVRKYLDRSGLSVDPFAGDCNWADHTNDRSHDTTAQHHDDVYKFAVWWCAAQKLRPDLIIWDPPFTYHQLKQCYGGGKLTQAEAQRFGIWPKSKDIFARLQPPGSYFLHCGHHSNGMGLKRGYQRHEMLVVCHGRAHYDTIILIERKA